MQIYEKNRNGQLKNKMDGVFSMSYNKNPKSPFYDYEKENDTPADGVSGICRLAMHVVRQQCEHAPS